MKFVTFSINISAFAFEREVFALNLVNPEFQHCRCPCSAKGQAMPRWLGVRGSSADACFIRRFDKIEIKATALKSVSWNSGAETFSGFWYGPPI
ncbi:MAG: hypothetical protein CM1200mP29_02200 [Verrucomicrobiota bacterium]|nr:MAG: hypothetical protein CM1200mP29_02200 [Verrucomicrobiota bacterium]